jgi:hypothetical protein
MSSYAIAFYQTMTLIGGGFVLLAILCLWELLFRAAR